MCSKCLEATDKAWCLAPALPTLPTVSKTANQMFVVVIETMSSNLAGSNIVVILYLSYQNGLRVFILNVVISGDFFLK